MCSINFTVTNKKFCLSLHYNEANSYLFVNGTEIYKFNMYKMFVFIKKVFHIIFLSSLVSATPLSCISVNN